MAKPTIDQPNWGVTLNDHLDSLASDIDARETPAGAQAKADAAVSQVATDASDPATEVGAALAATYVSLTKRPIHASDYGVLAGAADNTTALEAALAAGAGAAIHLPAGNIIIPKATRLPAITAPNTALVGDRSAATVLRFSHANGGLDVGDGAAYVYTTRLVDLIIDGDAACATPLRIRKGEEVRLDDVRMQNATVACMEVSDTSLTDFRLLQLALSPIGVKLGNGNGSLTFSNANISVVPEPFRVTGDGVTSFIYRDGWTEDCADFMTFASSAGAGFGRVVIRDSYFTSSQASASVFRAISGTVSANPGALRIEDSYFNWPSATTPMVDFAAVDNSGATIHVKLSDLTVSAPAYGAQVLIKPHASQAWSNFYVEADNIAGIPYSQWSAAHGVAGGVRLRPLRVFDHGNPEGLFAAPVGSIYQSSAGGTGTSLYVKETGTGNTGWVAK